jgi:hypothetical protein
MRRTPPRRRQRSGLRRLLRFLVAVAFIAVAAYGALVVVRDVQAGRTLSSRGVAASGQLVATDCHLCRAVGVNFTTATGQKVSAVVSAIGPQADATIALKYDPQHPTTVQPAHGVVEEEAIGAAMFVFGLLFALRCYGLPRRRRGRRRGSRVRTRGGSSPDQHGHVRVFRDN